MVPRRAGGGDRRLGVLHGLGPAHLGHATHVLDRFHVVRRFAAGMVAVRQRRQRREPRAPFDPAPRCPGRGSWPCAVPTGWPRPGPSASKCSSPPMPSWPGPGRCSTSSTSPTWPKTKPGPAMAALSRFADLYQADIIPELSKVVDTLLYWRRRSSASSGRAMVEQSHGGDQQQAQRPEAHGLGVHWRRELRGPRDPAHAGKPVT